MTDKIAVSIKEGAALISISKSKMYELVNREDCDFAFMLGGRRLINREKLQEWVNRQTESNA